METNIELHIFQEVLTKMNLLNITEAYPHFSKNGVVLYLMPCEKASYLYTKKQIEEIIRYKQNQLLNVVHLCND
jgi:hypothetical protein